jgi:hypothetical protein
MYVNPTTIKMSVAQYHRGQQDKDSRVQTYDKNEGEYVLKRIRVMKFNTAFNNISVISWQSVLFGGGNRSTERKQLTCCKSLTNFIA